ncbi:MAG: hypothetical protein WCA79_09790 [Anaerolineales bacterium]
MGEQYQHLGIFSDWVTEAKKKADLYPEANPGPRTQSLIRDVLGFASANENPRDVKIDDRWERDGLVGEEVSWSVGYGPRTQAYLIKPANANRRLPGIVALHDHSDFKYYGKEKIADRLNEALPILDEFRKISYGGRAYANALAREGFIVLVHDVFLWGSRRFPLKTMLEMMGPVTTNLLSHQQPMNEIESYNTAAYFHEHWVSKYCNILGTSLAGVVAFEDRVALNYLLSRTDVDSEHVGCIGLSGGGNRAAMLNALHEKVHAAVIVGLMTTYPALLDHNMSHTWMLFPFGWSRHGDWPDLAASRAPSPLLVQYNLQDDLFTENGMRAAHVRLQTHYANHPDSYTGQFYPGPHKFDLAMQLAAFDWLKKQLR